MAKNIKGDLDKRKKNNFWGSSISESTQRTKIKDAHKQRLVRGSKNNGGLSSVYLAVKIFGTSGNENIGKMYFSGTTSNWVSIDTFQQKSQVNFINILPAPRTTSGPRC